ncbi:TenA family protein [Microbacterium sp. SLBN-146]|uniref:TenA family protein n=1 Tax=Microbacterium sp. SLBN-146 TaxID=2768457 RepID=UPI0011735F23|nr:hypothetical protein [Microbacterium sp. SLBN-146]TQJ29989.1 thiaminase/transcriptional activator TenA [Microbacterium sp. SLBN-146]
MTTTDSLSQALRERIATAAAEWVELPMLSAVRSGTLARDVFRNYLEQDFVYLRYYARIYARLAAASRTDDELEHFIALAHGVLTVELDHHRRAAEPFGCDFDRISPSPALDDYVAFYEELANDREATLVAMLPCIYGYGIALSLVREATPSGSPYADWIDIYTAADYGALMELHFALIDEADIPLDRALEIAERGLALEIQFWNQEPARKETAA